MTATTLDRRDADAGEARAPTLTRVAYVDDDADIRAIARIALEDVGGFEVLLCGSGREAVETVPSFAPDLVLLDLRMPAMDGIETLDALRALPALADTPFVFMTAINGRDRVEPLLEAGAAGVIAKPFNPIGLSDVVRTIWEAAGKTRAA